MTDRTSKTELCVDSLEQGLGFLGVVGLEDKLQDHVDTSIECLQSAGLKIWMITGDKMETAQCISISTSIFKPKKHQWFTMVNITGPFELRREVKKLKDSKNSPVVLIIDGATLTLALEHCQKEFIDASKDCEAAVCCRVSPTQKSRIVEAVQRHTEYRVCAIGDGGNDVGMIQTAHLGIGIEGKEGVQASLAADFSITQFQYLTPLLLWHGRLSYLSTSKLSNFVFHRGFIIAVIQSIFFLLFYYVAIPIYNGYLVLGYATIFTSMPVFTLVLDRDTDFHTVHENANLYQKLQLGRALNFLRFLGWIWKSVYQGGAIILLAVVLFPENNFVNIVAITFSALILTELLNIATVIQMWSRWIVLAEILTFAIYATCISLLKNYFDLEFIVSGHFLWNVLLITICAWLPLHVGYKVKNRLFPDEGKKLGR